MLVAMLENRMNDAIAAFASRRPNAVVLDWRGLVMELGYNHLIDDKFWYMARVKLNLTALNALAAEYKRLRHAYTVGPKKVLVLDLDDTLWGGIIGEAGLGGIQLVRTAWAKRIVSFSKR